MEEYLRLMALRPLSRNKVDDGQESVTTFLSDHFQVDYRAALVVLGVQAVISPSSDTLGDERAVFNNPSE